MEKLLNEKYKLVGTMNLFGLIPSFVFPIFENNGRYYFQNSENSRDIDSFYEINGDNHINHIRFLNDSYNKLVNIKNYYSIGDEPIAAFQTSEDCIYIGDLDSFLAFIESYETKNKILEEEINEFKEDIKRAKQLKKSND